MSSDDLARRAALRLGSELDRNLPAAVEAHIQGGGAVPKRFDPGTTIALAALVVSVAQLAWNIYWDLTLVVRGWRPRQRVPSWRDISTPPAPPTISFGSVLKLPA
jgi:hypothetical protein